MYKAALSEVNEVVSKLKKQTRNKIRKSLQTIQAPANEQKITEEENMVFSDEKSLPSKEKQTKTAAKAVVEKENAPVVRRSKRRTAVTDTVTYVESPEESETSKATAKNPNVKSKKPASKTKKGRSTTVKKNEQKGLLNQTKLNFSPISVIPEEKEVPKDVFKSVDSENATFTISTITEDSGFDINAGTSQQNSPANSIAIFHSPDIRSNPVTPFGSEASILTIDSPPLSYWKDIAEQRRVVLERVLHENELLHDQLEVLEAENSQLKQLVKEAEELAQVVRGIIN